MLQLYLWVALGGAVGSVARIGLSDLTTRFFPSAFPWGTLIVNVLGSFLLGLAATLTQPEGGWSVPASTRHFVMAGFCGGFTTFSTFSLQTLNLIREGQWPYAIANIALSVAVCLGAVWAGHLAAVNLAAKH